MSVDNFISAVKAKRDEHIAAVTERVTATIYYGYDDRMKDTDAIIGAVLDVVEEQYGDIITAATEEGDDVTVSCASDLSTLYFEEVSN
jgi:hypothetical protein